MIFRKKIITKVLTETITTAAKKAYKPILQLQGKKPVDEGQRGKTVKTCSACKRGKK